MSWCIFAGPASWRFRLSMPIYACLVYGHHRFIISFLRSPSQAEHLHTPRSLRLRSDNVSAAAASHGMASLFTSDTGSIVVHTQVPVASCTLSRTAVGGAVSYDIIGVAGARRQKRIVRLTIVLV